MDGEGGRARDGSTRARFDPMDTSWTVIVGDIVAVLLVTAGCFAVASAIGDGWVAYLWYLLLGGVALFVFVALPLRHFLLAQRREADEREGRLTFEGQRREFTARLGRALDMAQDEPAALAVAGRALAEILPEGLIQVRLADSSRAHLRTEVETPTVDVALSGCSVATPHACPAVRQGHTVRFDDSTSLDVCPHLAGRTADPCAAVCAPVGVMGSMVGVVHAVHRRDVPIDASAIDRVEIVARQIGMRVGVLSAISQSQIQANTDPLTGLLNRRSLENEAHLLMRSNVPIALAFADLDHFKQLNDAHGHDMGDRALRLFARTMQRSLPPATLVSRFGGEEFVIVFPQTRARDAADLFDVVRTELETALSDGRVPPFTVSAGIADNVDNDMLMLEDLIGIADGWLLRAKHAGRNRTLWGGQPDNIVVLNPGAAAPHVPRLPGG